MKARLLVYIALVVVAAFWIAMLKNNHFTDWLYKKSQGEGKKDVFQFTPGGTNWVAVLKTPWTITTVVLYRPDGQVVQLNAQRAIYSFWSAKSKNPNKHSDMPVIAFVDPVTRNAWIGAVNSGERETNEYNGGAGLEIFYLANTNFFIETGSGIFEGDTEINDGSFTWLESPIKRPLLIRSEIRGSSFLAASMNNAAVS